MQVALGHDVAETVTRVGGVVLDAVELVDEDNDGFADGLDDVVGEVLGGIKAARHDHVVRPLGEGGDGRVQVLHGSHQALVVLLLRLVEDERLDPHDPL